MMTNFCLDFCIRLKFQNCQISSALDLLMRPAGIVCHWTQFQFPGFIVRRFKVFKSSSFATKESSCLLGKFLVSSITSWWLLFTTNGVENSVFFHCLTFFFFALDAKKILLLHFRCPLKCSDV